jgi:hypothetical protein
MTTFDFASLLTNEFASEVRKGLPYCQILNAPNMTQVQLDQFKPSHGIFISKENADGAGLITDGLTPHTQSFRDGEEIVDGYIFERLRFVVLHISPLVVQSQNQLVGLYFAPGGGVSDIGRLVSQQPKVYHSRSWWLIAPLTDTNELLSCSPIKLSMRGAVGATFSQERKATIQEMEIEFFKKAKTPRQTLSGKAHICFVMDWKFGYYKAASDKAPHEYVSLRKGIADEQKTISSYGTGKNTRNVTIIPESLENLLIVPSSHEGQILAGWYDEYQESFFQRIKGLITPAAVEVTEEIEPVDIEVEIAEFAAKSLEDLQY